MSPLAVVTGASSGIGYALAEEFARNGFDLLVTAERELTPAVDRLRATGARVRAARADLRTYDGVEELYREIRAAGPVDAIALNAGIGSGGPFSTGPDLKCQFDVVRLNVMSQVHLARRVLPDLVARGSGRVLFTSSIAATRPGPFEAVYAASKAFVFSFAEALRAELAGTGVTVTALLPGPKDDPAVIAARGFEALMKGRDQVVAGSLLTTMLARASKVGPEKVKSVAHIRMSRLGRAG